MGSPPTHFSPVLNQRKPQPHALMADGKASRRKKHRNSKLGCATCKRRRVKCSEDLPECINCAKHNSHCEYLDYSEKQLEAFRRCKAEQQKSKDSVLNAVSTSSDPAASLESLSLGIGFAPHKVSRKTAQKPRVPENIDASSQSNHSNEHSLAPSRQPSLPSLPSVVEGGSISSHSDTSISMSSTTQVTNIPSTDLNFKVPLHQVHGPLKKGYSEHASADFMNHNSTDMPPGYPNQNIDPNINHNINHNINQNIDPNINHNINQNINRNINRNMDSAPDKFSAASGLTQDFDNLLSTQDQEIIYPIYSSTVGATYRVESSDQSPFESLGVLKSESLDQVPALSTGTALPNAVRVRQKFKALESSSKVPINYTARLFETVRELRPLISEGLASLNQIRNLYHEWLGSFIYSAYRSQVMFSCLVNLTTNFLISNVFSSMEQERLDAFFQVPNFRDTLITHSIQHYAVAIRELRSLLNFNIVPNIAASVSYILSLMSMYDPEATINSTICFRDGMFSVLGYSLHIAKKNFYSPQPLVPIHLQLVGNISRTIYFPAYDPMFLIEYEHMLHRLSLLFSQVSSSVTNASTFEFLYKTLEEFRQICHDTNTTYIPMANSNLRDLKRQTEVTFTLFYRWARFNPTRLLVTRQSTDPLEKLLNSFIILFRKAVYAILPQGKFIYLRDLNSPLMLDVFNTFDDIEFYRGLDNPDHVCIDRNLYQQSLTEIKTLAAYTIRVSRFIGARTQFLYTSLVYNEKVRHLYPIKNMVEWRLSLTDIHATRKEFQERIGLVETMIKSFNTTYISTHHYPRILSNNEPQEQVSEEPTPTNLSSEPWVDLLSMDNRGLLSKDQPPPFSS